MSACILCDLPPYPEPARDRAEVFAYGFVVGCLRGARFVLCPACETVFQEALAHYRELAEERVDAAERKGPTS